MVGFSLHQRAGDTTCLIPHLEGVRANLSVIARRKPEILPQQDHQPRCLPQNISADAGYGSEENYAYFESIAWATMSNTTPFIANYKSIANRNWSAKPSSVLRTCPTMLQKTSSFARLTNV